MAATEAISALHGLGTPATTGLSKLIGSGDVALLALTTCLVIALIGNIVQYYVGNRRQDKDFDRYLAVIEALKDVNAALISVQSVLMIIQAGSRND